MKQSVYSSLMKEVTVRVYKLSDRYTAGIYIASRYINYDEEVTRYFFSVIAVEQLQIATGF